MKNLPKSEYKVVKYYGKDLEIPQLWQINKLGDLLISANQGVNTAIDKVDYVLNGYPLIKAGDVRQNFDLVKTDKISSKSFQNIPSHQKPSYGDILYANIGSRLGTAKYVDFKEDTAIAWNVFLIRIKRTIYSLFLNYYLNYTPIRNILTSTASIATMPFISKPEILSLNVITPTLIEQQKIASILSNVDELIRKTEQIKQQTQRLKKGLMQRLLTKGIGHTKFKKTELGNIPQEWVVSSIGTKCKLGTGGTPSRSNPTYFKGEIPWVKTTEINFNKINTTEEHITKKAVEESSAKVFPKGSLLMAMYGQGITRGRTAILEIDAAINQACAAIQSLGEISIPFLFYWCQYNYEKIRSISQGTHQSNLNLEYVANIKIPLPSMPEQAKVVSILLNIDSLLENQKSNKKNAEYLKSGLMQKLLTGKIRAKV